ncbi:LysR family transcriptional regulator [Novosphingobium pentaromativorans]|uniref:LysR family transcriptional regulator n=1 Tax=Novosphingobium pentaromativorans US6-1 TaxID=1088721 RepID=G6EGN6_9SPHN|nr:LysR family transcriptional regulator [Novosphingobium pentaromativorans]AIT82139.1 LysR family transcriptional regulator [Novosphingobium pentaromativorans US6-1]EHJ59583.1 LysR family transcriptional regulator [Novosphingobium pentaromativorans US6-1]
MALSDSRQIDQLSALVCLASTHSFTAAGRMLQRHPTVISKRIASLEARLGVRLVERSTRQVRLTDAGVKLVEKIIAANELLDEAQQEATSLSSEVSGRLRIAFPATMGRLWIAPRLPDFAAAHPHLELEADFDDGFVDLVAGGYDAAIRIGHLADSSLVARKLADHQRVLAASPTYLERSGVPVNPAELSSHRCLGNPRLASFPIWKLSDGENLAAVRTQGPFRTNDSTAMLEAARAGLGIIGAGEWLVAKDIASGRLVRVMPKWTFDGDGGIYLVRPSGRYASSRVEAFAEWIEDLVTSLDWTTTGRG